MANKRFPSNHFGVPVINIQDLNSSLYVTQSNNYVLNLDFLINQNDNPNCFTTFRFVVISSLLNL